MDAKTLQVTAHYDISSKGGGPGGLAMDAKNHILFAFCHDPHTAVILNADNGDILASLPIGDGVDAAEFNPNTSEAFSSQRDGTLTVIKEDSPTSFEVEQTVTTQAGARTSTLDAKTNQVYLVTAEMAPPTTQPAAQATTQAEAAPRIMVAAPWSPAHSRYWSSDANNPSRGFMVISFSEFTRVSARSW